MSGVYLLSWLIGVSRVRMIDKALSEGNRRSSSLNLASNQHRTRRRLKSQRKKSKHRFRNSRPRTAKLQDNVYIYVKDAATVENGLLLAENEKIRITRVFKNAGKKN